MRYVHRINIEAQEKIEQEHDENGELEKKNYRKNKYRPRIRKEI